VCLVPQTLFRLALHAHIPDALEKATLDQKKPESPEVDLQAVLRERAAERRSRQISKNTPISDPVTPVRIRQTLANFLDRDFESPQAMQAAVDAYANEVALLEQEGRVVGRILGAGAARSGASVNEVRRAIESFLSSPLDNVNESLDATARLLADADLDIPDGSTSFFSPLNPPLRGDDDNPRTSSSLPLFPGQVPRTSASDAAFRRAITNEAQLLEAERKVAEQMADMKHQRQQAQLQHQRIQKLMARQKDEEEIEGVMSSAKVIREQKDLLRNWQAAQQTLLELKVDLRKLQHEVRIC